MSSLDTLSSQDSSSKLLKIPLAYLVGVVHLIDLLDDNDKCTPSVTQAWKQSHISQAVFNFDGTEIEIFGWFWAGWEYRKKIGADYV